MQAYFRGFGLENVRHYLMTTQHFVETEEYPPSGRDRPALHRRLPLARAGAIRLSRVRRLLEPRGIALFHDSMVLRPSVIYGADRAYEIRVRDFLDELKRDPGVQLFDVPFGTGVTLVRKTGGVSSEPLLEGLQGPLTDEEGDRRLFLHAGGRTLPPASPAHLRRGRRRLHGARVHGQPLQGVRRARRRDIRGSLRKYPLEAADGESLPVPCRYVSFAGHYAGQILRDLERIRPSLVISDTFAVIGRVAANRLGIPYVNVCAGHNVDPPSSYASFRPTPVSASRRVASAPSRSSVATRHARRLAVLLCGRAEPVPEPLLRAPELSDRGGTAGFRAGGVLRVAAAGRGDREGPAPKWTLPFRGFRGQSTYQDVRLLRQRGVAVLRGAGPGRLAVPVRLLCGDGGLERRHQPRGRENRGTSPPDTCQEKRVGRAVCRSMEGPAGFRPLRHPPRTQLDARGHLPPRADDLVPVLLGSAGARGEMPASSAWRSRSRMPRAAR